MKRVPQKSATLAGVVLMALLVAGLLIYVLVRGTGRSALPGDRAGTVRALRAHASGYHVTWHATATTSGAGAWISLQSDAATPGALDIGIAGAGFAPAEAIEVRVSGHGGTARANLHADRSGRVFGTVQLRIAPIAAGPLQLVALGEQSHREATATFSVVPYVPVLSLTPYAAPPGGSIDVYGRGFAPHEAVRLSANGRFVAWAHADTSGALHLHPGYTIPSTARAGRLTFTATGELSKQSALQRAYVLPLRPWARASAYVVHAGDRVQFDVHGFAPGEIVKVYAGRRYVGQSSGPTDGRGNAGGLGPFAVRSGSQAPTFTFIGVRSRASTMVTVTMLS